MRHRLILIGLLLLATGGGIATLSGSKGQPPNPGTPSPVAITPINPIAVPQPADAVKQAVFVAPAQPEHDLNRMPPFTRQVHVSAHRGAEWLNSVNNPVTGRFIYGWVTALNIPLEGDHYLHQAGAAFALARAARYFGEDRYTLKARQAVLSLMAETAVDPGDPTCRHTAMPPLAVNRLAAAGLLLMAIHELPSPADDLLKQGEELANSIRKRQNDDGSFRVLDGTGEAAKDSEAVQTYPGIALYGLMLSQRHRPAPWKTDVARKAVVYYSAWWKANPNAASVPMLTAAFAEAYLLTKEPAFADCVFEMTDWVCGLQYLKDDVRKPVWIGGFRDFADGKPVAAAPTVRSAAYLEGLAQACRVTRQIPDAARYERYANTAAFACQFLMGLQFGEDSTRHFAPNHRSLLSGGFHTSHQDGNLCVTANRHAVAGMIQFLPFTVDR
jgi:hypothetical protein